MASNRSTISLERQHLHGVPAVIYVLENSSLRNGFCKIGVTRRSGWAKAIELNRDIHNSIPGTFACVLELTTPDGGAVLEAVVQELQYCRRGKKEQNFFEAEPARVRETVLRAVANTKNISRHPQVQSLRRSQEQEIVLEPPKEKNGTPPRGLFRKALRWMAAS